jgi:hypothetical protein
MLHDLEHLTLPSQVARVPPGLDAWFERATKTERSQREKSLRLLANDLKRLAIGYSGRCQLLDHEGELLRIEAYPSTNSSYTERASASVAVAINGRRDIDHIALIAKLSRTTGILWTRHRAEPGQWIRLTLHIEDGARGHSTLAKVLRLNEAPSARPSMWAYEVTVRFAQPLAGMSSRL